MFQQLSTILLTLLVLSCLTGCGNTGALYLPQDADTNPENTES